MGKRTERHLAVVAFFGKIYVLLALNLSVRFFAYQKSGGIPSLFEWLGLIAINCIAYD